MTTKEVKIIAPEGYEIDKENSTLECIKFKEKETIKYANNYYPRNWDDFSNYPERIYTYQSKNAYSSYYLGKLTTPRGFAEFDTKDEAIAFAALGKLIQLRDWWWDNICKGWHPNFLKDEKKYSIEICEYKILKAEHYRMNSILVFPTKEIRDEFLETYSDLIEKAKDLL